MTASKKLQFIHDNRKTHRRWVHLDADTKRAILNLLPDSPDEQTILKTIRKIRRESCTNQQNRIGCSVR
jgi:hypothetical protein